MEICLIDAEGLDEEIRCEMCRNPMRSNTGCDGGCTYDEKLYEKIVHLLNERIKPLPSIKPEPGQKTGVCSVCKRTILISPYTGGFSYSFCPYCGADMRGGQDG